MRTSIGTALFVITVALFGASSGFAATKTWTGTANDGRWTNGANWGGTAPAAADTANIPGGLATAYPNITNSVTVAVVNTTGSVTVAAGGTFTVTTNFMIGAAGSLSQSGGTINSTAGISISGIFNQSGGTLLSEGSVTINSGGTITNSGGTIWLAVNTSTAPTDNMVVNGSLKQSGGTHAVRDLSGSGTMAMQNGLLKIYRDYKPTTPANFTATGGTVEFAANGGYSAFPDGNYQFCNILIDGGIDPSLDNNHSGTFLVSGNWTNNGDPSLSGTTVEFNGTTNQNIGGSSTSPFDDLKLSGGANKILIHAVTIDGTLTLSGSAVANLAYSGGTTSTANALVIGGTNMASGTWGSTNSTATHKDSTHFSGTGTVMVAKPTQTITFPSIANQLTTNKVGLAATASSGLSVSFSVLSGSASISGSTNLTFSGAGSVKIVASQPGNTNWSAAPNVTNAFDVTKATQSALVFSPTTPQTYNTTNTLSATGGSGTGVVSYAVQSGAGQIVGSNGLKMLAGTGTVSVVATKAADDLYNVRAATGMVAAAKSTQAITFPSIADQLTTNKVGLAATASSGLSVSFSVLSGSASISGSTNLTFSGAGSVKIVAAQAGNTNWNPAPNVTNAFNVTKTTASVTLNNLSQTYDGTPCVVTATTVPSGLTVDIAYNGSGTAPTAVGSYAVTGTVNEVMYQGSKTGTLVVAKATQTIIFPSIADQLTTNKVGLAATASSGLSVSFSVLSGSASISGSTNLTFSGAGSVKIVAAQAGNTNWNPAPNVTNAFNVTKTTASVTLNNLSQTYDGTPCVVTASTEPCHLTVDITYDGSATAPADAGSYAITGTVDDVMYLGAKTGTLVVAQKELTVTGASVQNKPYDGTDAATITDATLNGVVGTEDVVLANETTGTFAQVNTGTDLDVATAPMTITGTDIGNYTLSQPTGLKADILPANQTISFDNPGAHETTNKVGLAATSSSGLSVSFAVESGLGSITDDTNLTFSGAGDVVIVASQAGTTNWNPAPSVTNTFAVTKALASVTLNDLSQTYDGTPRVVTASTEPVGLSVDITYDGNASAPTDAGSYAVTGTVNDVMYQGSQVDTLVVAKADQTITFDPIDTQETTNHIGLSASSSSGLGVSFAVESGPGSITDDTNLTFSGAGDVVIVASQAGNENWNPAPSVTNTFAVTKTVAGVTLNDLSQTYDGTPRVVTASTEPDGLSVDITYDASASAPTDAGSYAVTGTVNDVMYQGSQVDTLVVAKADQTITFDPIDTQVQSNLLGLAATASSGLSVSFSVLSGPGLITSETNLSFTGHGVVSIMAYQVGASNWNPAAATTTTFTVLGLFNVTIESDHGTATPGPGIYTYVEGTEITNTVTGFDTGTKTQFVCTGWMVTDIEVSNYSETQVVITVTNDTTLTWLWTTNYWLSTEVCPHGSVNIDEGWQASGVTTSITATACQYYHFTNWTGSASGNANPLDILMDAPKTVTAIFAANMTTNAPAPVPEEWLAQYGLTNFEVDVNADPDHDGQSTWEEYIGAETDPTNPASFFYTGIGQGSLLVSWPSASGRVYDVETTVDMTGHNWTLTEWTNQPATPPMNTVTNPLGALTNAMQFFRAKGRME